MRKWLLIGLLIPSISSATSLSNFWASNGNYKLAKQDLLPNGNCSSCTITETWDGTTMKLYSAKGEAVSGVLYMGNGTEVDISSVSVAISSFTGPSGSGIVSTPCLLAGVTSYINRPIETFLVRYLHIRGQTTLSWPTTEYEERDFPKRFQLAYTVNGNDQGVVDGTPLWTNRRDHGKAYPEVLVPMEAFAVSSFTVAASSSQAVWFDVWVASSLPAGAYTASITVKEGVDVSTTIPVSLTVWDFVLPSSPSLKAVAHISGPDITKRILNETYPAANDPTAIATRNRFAQMLHRHKFSGAAGDNATGADYCGDPGDQPCPEFVSQLNGSLYSPTSGYANGPGVGVGDTVYSVGTYQSWAGAGWSQTDASDFCGHVGGWGTYMGTNFPNVLSFVYLADETLTNVDKWSTWMSTVTACQTDGYTVRSFVTSSWPSVNSTAPRLNMPSTTDWMGTSSTTWANMASIYETQGTTQAWAYNTHPPWSGSAFATEDDGIGPLVTFWAMHKKGVQGWFFWNSTYYRDSGVSGRENDLFNEGLTFGGDTSYNNALGRTGYGYSNGDGVLMYPGTDYIINNPSYGLDGPIAGWRLKMIRAGIQQGDYLALAYAVDPSSTTALVNEMVPEVLWEHHCFDPEDCSYAYGGRQWTDDPNAWMVARERLATIITGAPATPYCGDTSCNNGETCSTCPEDCGECEEPLVGGSGKTFSGSVTFGGGGTFH